MSKQVKGVKGSKGNKSGIEMDSEDVWIPEPDSEDAWLEIETAKMLLLVRMETVLMSLPTCLVLHRL